MLAIGIGSLTVVIVVLCYFWVQTKKKLEIAEKIRVGYEKKYNTFKLKYTILSKLENEKKIIENVKKLPQPIYIYGGGIVGDKLLSILQKENSIEVLRVIEGRELEKNPEYGKELETERVILVTPVFDYDNIVRLLKKYFQLEKIVGIDEIID